MGIFHRRDDAFAALRRLDVDGLPADHVGIVAGDTELAGQVAAHDHARIGAAAGFVLGLIISVLYVAMGGPGFARNMPGLVLGAAFVSFGLAFIGIVFGRALVTHTSHRAAYEHAIADGGAIVTVECVGKECDHARHVLEGAAADEIVEEAGV